MSHLEKYKGIIPAFYACYGENGEIDSDRVKALTRYFIDKGVKGLYVNGSSGECIYQSVADRKQVLEAVMEEARGKTMWPATISRTVKNWPVTLKNWVLMPLQLFRRSISAYQSTASLTTGTASAVLHQIRTS